jgi:hypothetical protein
MSTAYFYVPDVDHPSGGVRAIYRFVDACNAAGMQAAVLHQRPGFRATWFNNTTEVVAARTTPVNGSDVLVVSELDAPELLPRTPGLTKVILNQQHYWTFLQGAVNYRHPDVASVIAVSTDGERYLSAAFPGIQPHRIRYAVDTTLFRPSPDSKKRDLVFLAAKGMADRQQVCNILDNRGRLATWNVEGLSGLTQESMARRLGKSTILAAFSPSEGFQMLLTEAMAAGCAVVGYTGGGGNEYLTEALAWPVEAGDVVGFVERIEEVAQLWDEDSADLQAKLTLARSYVEENHSLAREAHDIVEALQPALDRASTCGVSPSYDLGRSWVKARDLHQRIRGAGRALLH